jgi:hypothetical protein
MLVVPLTESRVLFAIAVRLKNSKSSAISSSTGSMVMQAESVWGAIVRVVSLMILASRLSNK